MRYRYDWHIDAMPERYTYDKTGQKLPLNELALDLAPGKYGRAVCNGRFRDWDTGIWYYLMEDGTTCSPIIDGSPQTYVEYGKWFYPTDLPLEAVRRLAGGAPVTKELAAALNPKRSDWEEIRAGLDRIGYPREL